VSPIVRSREFQGTLLGAIDLAKSGPIEGEAGKDTLIVLATKDGAVVYPPVPPAFSSEPTWKTLFAAKRVGPDVAEAPLAGATSIVASSPVSGTDMILLTVARRSTMFVETRARLETRLALGVLVALAPFVALVLR